MKKLLAYLAENNLPPTEENMTKAKAIISAMTKEEARKRREDEKAAISATKKAATYSGRTLSRLADIIGQIRKGRPVAASIVKSLDKLAKTAEEGGFMEAAQKIAAVRDMKQGTSGQWAADMLTSAHKAFTKTVKNYALTVGINADC